MQVQKHPRFPTSLRIIQLSSALHATKFIMKLSPLTSPALPILAAAQSTTTTQPPPTAALDSGPIFGVQTQLPGAASPVNKFLGIPYGAPPVRFARAGKPQPWKEAYNATAFGPACRQLFVENGKC